MNTRESDEEQYQWLLERRRDARKGNRWMQLLVYGAFLVLLAALIASRADAQTACPWDADCLSWTIATTRIDGSALEASKIASHRLEIATSATGPWTVLATVPMPATTYQRRPVSGTNYYRIVTVLHTGLTSDPSAAVNSTVVEPKPNPAVLQVVDNVGYQINLGSRNKFSLSRVASIPLGKECIATMSATDPYRTVHVIKDRLWAVMDPDPRKPGEFYKRPNQVWAKCGA